MLTALLLNDCIQEVSGEMCQCLTSIFMREDASYIRSKSELSLSYAFINSPHLVLTKVIVLHLLHIIWDDQVKNLKTFYDHCP